MKSLTLCLCASILFLSCTKNEDSPVKLEDTHYVISSKTFRYPVYGGVDSIKQEYSYNSDGRLVKISRGAVIQQTMTYSGSTLTNIQYYTPTSPTTYDIFDKGNQFVSNPDSSQIRFVLGERFDENGFDTGYHTYTFNNSIITSYKNYFNSSTYTEPKWAMFRYEYGSNGNLVKHYYSDENQVEFLAAEVLTTDDKKNPLNLLSKTDYVFLSQPASFISTSSSKNNVTSYRDENGVVKELEYTYNAEGYPLTIKAKGDSFVMAEFTYAEQ